MTFEFDGQKYTQAATHQQEWGARLMAELDLRQDARILDLGCGDGLLTAQLAARVPQGFVLGLDASAGMVAAAQSRRQHNLKFEQVDINNLAFADEFDLVFSNAALHWLKDHHRLLAAVYRSLKAGGQVRFNFAGEGNCAHFYRVVKAVMAQNEYTDYFCHFEWPWYMPPVDEYRSLVSQVPFSETRVWGENADRYFPDTAAMVRWLDQPSLVPFLGQLPQPHQVAFRQQVIDRMVEVSRQPDGRCFEMFRRINLYAKK